MEEQNHHTFNTLEVFIAEQLEFMGYQDIQCINVDYSRHQFSCRALLTVELVAQLAAVYFGSERFAMLQELSKQGLIEFVVFPDRQVILTIDGNPVRRSNIEAEQRRIIGELEIVLKSKVRADLGYVRRLIRQKN